MSAIRIFIDFGSTFTKLTAFDLEQEELIARIQVPSTVDSDITEGLEAAFAKLTQKVAITSYEMREAVACSSAAGGLRIVCVGLVPEYTTLAGRMAALGAGAKIIGEFSYDLTMSELKEIERIAPDIVLLTGGTDGGNKKAILHNARILSGASQAVKNIIVAGNKSAYDEMNSIFTESGKHVVYTKNVMPEIGVLDVDSTNEKIREMFIDHITAAKGITKVKNMISDVIMPTPSAVLEAAKILAGGTAGESGLGELMLVDLGGATTDVYSVAHGAAGKSVVNVIGLPEPYVKRTVEGDLGLVHNMEVLEGLARSEDVSNHSDDSVSTQLLLSQIAVKTAVRRHAGSIKAVPTTSGDVFIQKGKDLTEIQCLIGSGGGVSFSSDPLYVLRGALYENANPTILTPKSPEMMLDQYNILYAVGLLSRSSPESALRIGKKYLLGLKGDTYRNQPYYTTK